MSDEGLKLAALFSYRCPRSKELEINRLLFEFIRNGAGQNIVERELQRLLSYGYYQIIASRNNIEDVFDERVVWAYWIGDDELVKPIESETGVLLPFHNFTVFESIHRKPDADPDNCRMSVTRVKEVAGDKLYVYHQPLIREDNKFSWPKKSEARKIDRGFVTDVTEQDWVAYHWGVGRKRLQEKEALSLYRKTEEAIKLFNEGQQEVIP